ncbi:MAG: pentapeptide repeat-containing protein, partial [Actinomycetes bacterium]
MPYQRDGRDQVIKPNTDPFYDSQYNNGSWGECGGLFYGFVDGILDKSPRRVEPGVNWKGANLSCPEGKRDEGFNTQLVYARLSGASLERANLTGVNLAGADLSKARLGRDLTDSEQAAVDLQWGIGKLTAKLVKKEVKGLIMDAAAGELAKAFPAEIASATSKAVAAVAYVGLDGVVDVTSLAAKDFAKTLLGPVGTVFRAIRFDKIFAKAKDRRTDLTNANLTRADLSEAHLVETGLSGANLTDANLNGAVMMAADVSGADFGTNGEKLSGVISSDLIGWPSRLPTNWTLVNGRLVGPGANLTSADLSGADLRGVSLAKAVLVGADLTGANLTGVDLTGAQLLNATLTNANLKNTNLTSADLTDVDMPGVKSGGITATDLDLPADWTLTSGYLVGPGADLTGSNLTGVDLTGRFLPGVNFTDSILTGANLTDFFSVDGSLDGVRTGGLTGGEFYNPVNGQILGGRGPDLRNANLDGVDLSAVDLVGTRSGGITGTPSALPPNWQLASGFLVGPGADFSGANLDGVDLRTLLPAYDQATGWSQTAGYTANPSGAAIRFITTKYGGISGTPLLPAGWRVVNGRLAGPFADLRNADLTGASLDGLNLNYALLSGVRSGGVTGTPSSWPTNYGLVNGYILGPNVNPREDMTVPLDLGSAPDLRGILLAGANLGKVKYTGVNFVFEPATAAFDYKVIPTPAVLAYLAGPGSNISGDYLKCAEGSRYP